MHVALMKLNNGWNAEPNSPNGSVAVDGGQLDLTFWVNAFMFRNVAKEDVGRLRFMDCSRYRLGPTNDEGWYRGQCRYTGLAPAWGEFYELVGADPLADKPRDWRPAQGSGTRHFIFYLRDQTFECFAGDWSYVVERHGA